MAVTGSPVDFRIWARQLTDQEQVELMVVGPDDRVARIRYSPGAWATVSGTISGPESRVFLNGEAC